jgi:hypothetical protein
MNPPADYKVPIHYIAYDYGLLDCYLNEYSLVLVFDKDVAISDLQKTTSNYYSFIDRLVDYSMFHKMETYEDLLCVWLNIPWQYHDDIDLIKQSKYSHVSDLFKDKMQMRYTIVDKEVKVPPFDHPIAQYIVRKNIPARIVTKAEKLKKELATELGLDSDSLLDDVEYYTTWKDDREIWSSCVIKRYL